MINIYNQERNYHDGFKFQRANYVSCDMCGDGTLRKETHMIPGETKEEPVMFVCDSCYEEYKEEQKAPLEAEKQFSEIVSEFTKAISKGKESLDE